MLPSKAVYIVREKPEREKKVGGNRGGESVPRIRQLALYNQSNWLRRLVEAL